MRLLPPLGSPRRTAATVLAPGAVTGPASSVTSSSATLGGTVNPNGVATSYQFQYGLTVGYGMSTVAAGAGSGTSSVAVQTSLTALKPSTVYHYRLVASSKAGTTYGLDQMFSTAAAPAAVTPSGVAGTWVLKFADEFNAGKLDATKWSTGWFGSGITQAVDTADELNCYDPRQVAVANGELDITAIAKQEACGGVTQPYATGLINSDGKYNFTYGVYEARVWLPGASGKIADWPAVWADGQNWPDDGEIDVLEGLGGSPCYTFHYAGGDPGGCTTVTGATSGWHTYAVDWEPGSLTFYYDGKSVWQTTTGVTNQPMYLILDLAVSRSISPPVVVPATMRVDYVRVWQHS